MALPLASINGDVKVLGTQVPHAEGWGIKLDNKASEYVTNLTKGKTARRPGNSNVTGTFRILTSDGNMPSSVLPGKTGRLQLYSDATHYWDINDAIFLSAGLDVNIATGEIEAIVIEWGFAGKNDATTGSVVAPDGSVIDSAMLS